MEDKGTEESFREMVGAMFLTPEQRKKGEISYENFLQQKQHLAEMGGFEPLFLPSFLFDFQRFLVDWAVKKGRAAIFADCGLGKTPMQLVWAENVVQKTNKNVLILTPLAVSFQTVKEAEKFNIEARRSRRGEGVSRGAHIVVSNYERLHFFHPQDFAGVVCDESSILKNFDGATKQAVTEFMKKIPYRLLCTATAAPNDFIELGTSSEALGYLGHMDMLNRFFKNDQNTSGTGRFHGQAVKWRFKGHAEIPFWRWVCSWARAIRKPSDFGFADHQFQLPPLREQQHEVVSRKAPEGMLFALPAVGLAEQRAERSRTIIERCELVAKILEQTDTAIAWCHLNQEGDLLEKLIPKALQVSGKDSDEEKEEKFLAFVNREAPILITKPSIGAWGLNFQHCANMTFFPSHSYEQYYQGVRRCWRFGQVRPVVVDIISTEGERNVLKNLQRKSEQADRLFTSLTRQMQSALSIEKTSYQNKEEVPSWLS